MSRNHVPMHESNCPRCDRRRHRVAAYEKRMQRRESPEGQMAELKAGVARRKRSKAYVALHPHGKRRRAERSRLRAARRRANRAVVVHLEAMPPRSARVKRAYCTALGHKWSGLKYRNAAGAMRTCERGSCNATEFVKPEKPATAAA
jgi:hypothetical protein